MTAASRLRVLFIQRTVPPDPSAVGNLLLDLAPSLDSRRFDVTVLATRIPNDAPREERCDGIRILRAGRLPFSRRSVLHRLLGLVGAWLALGTGALRVKRSDVIVTLTDPPLFFALGGLIARLRGCRHVHWVQDVYPEVAVAGGVIHEGGVLHCTMEAIATRALRHCDAVIVIGRCMAARLRACGVDARRLFVVPNWGRENPSRCEPVVVAEYRETFDASGKFLLLYSGNLGLVHDFETVLGAAEILLRRDANVVIGIAGDGPRRAWIESEVRMRSLQNVRMIPPQAWDRFSSLLAAADAHLVTLRAEFRGLVVPSKIYDAAASGRPLLFVGPDESEAARAILECGGGASVRNGDVESFVEIVERWAGNPDEARALGERVPQLSAGTKESAVREFTRVLRSAAAQEHD